MICYFIVLISIVYLSGTKYFYQILMSPNYLPRLALWLVLLNCCVPAAFTQSSTLPQQQEIAALLKKANRSGPKDTVTTKQLIQQAEDLATSLRNDTCLAQVNSARGVLYAQLGAAQTALGYFEKQLSFARASGYQQHIAVALRNTANILADLGNTDLALARFRQAIDICRKVKLPQEESRNLVNIGITTMGIGRYDQSMAALQEALSLNEKINDQDEIAYVQYTLAGLFNRMKNFDKALEYNQLALQSFRQLKNELIVSSILFNMATIQTKRGQFEEAKNNLTSILPYFEKINSSERLRKTYVQLLNIADQTNNETDAANYLQLALQYSKMNGAAVNDVGILINQARMDILNKRYPEAEQKLQSSLTMAQKANAYLEILNVRRQLIVLYQESGQPAKAVRALAEYDLAKEKVLNEENLSRLNELQTQYETEKKESRIALLDKENNIKGLQIRNDQLELERKQELITRQEQSLTITGLELKNKQQLLLNQQLDADKQAQNIKDLEKQSQLQHLELANRTLAVRQRNYAIMAILVAVAAIGMLVYSFYRRQKLRQEHRLQEEIYKQQEIATKAVFDGEQQERIRIARDLHDSIGQMLSVVQMNLSTLDNNIPVTHHTRQLVDKTITEVRNISHNLIPEELNFGLFNALEDMVRKINEAGSTQIALHMPADIHQLQLAQQNELSVYRIVQEVLHNMIRHAQASQIRIEVQRYDQLLTLVIKDNGQGFDTTAIRESKGIGWKNIAARVHLLNGQLQIVSERLSGTTIEISIPA